MEAIEKAAPAKVIPLFGQGMPAIDPNPNVLTGTLVANLAVLNRAVRTLRSVGIKPVALDYITAGPTIVVDSAAASKLRKMAHGYSARRLRVGERLHSVEIDGCKVHWIGRDQP